MSAFVYLVLTSGRNRFGGILRRVRSPRYGVALVVGVLYLWAFLLRPTAHNELATSFLSRPTEMIVSLLVVVTLMGSWVFGSDLTALAFSQAEVSLLFSAPLSRRALIGYKLFRAQIAVLINALIWVFVLRRGGTNLSPLLRAFSLWLLFSTLNLHRLGAALVRSSWREHGRAGAKRHLGATIVFAAVGIGIIGGLVMHRAEFVAVDGGGIAAYLGALGRVLASSPASLALWPFHLIVAPTFARTLGQWSAAIWPAMLMLLLHLWWVLRTDAAFEEAAIEASAARARRLESKARRLAGGGAVPSQPRRAASTFKLAAAGSPAMAIVWKNMLCLRRTAQLRVFVSPIVMSIVIGTATSGAGAGPAVVVAVSALAMAAMLLMFGGRLVRNDLRHDMQHLPLIKSLPVEPKQILLAEVASAALPISAVQFVLIVAAYVAIMVSGQHPITSDLALGLLIASPFAVLSLNGALLTIQNGMAVLFPAWVRLGPIVSTGVEALGQNLLATVANLLALALALVIPALLAWTAVVMLPQPRPLLLALLVIVASVVLAIETLGMMRYLGGALERAEPL